LNLIVPDASVAAKWFLPRSDETLVREAIGVLRRYESGQIQLIVPSIFWAEIGNVFWKAVRLGRWPEEAALTAAREMVDRQFPTIADSELLIDAISIALHAGRTVYDSLYVALALPYNAEMVTADERLANSVAARFPVKWLGAMLP
jgi:predicted nucleic acid-binding protein